MPTTPVDQTSWPRDKITRVVHHTFRGRPVPGLRATPILGGNLELDARRARRGKPASLAAVDVNSGHRHPRSIVARLVPGSEAETSTPAAGVIVGRFLDHPSELRTRFFANDGSLIDLPAPVAGASNPIVRSGTIAVATADAITLQVPAYDGERGTTLVVPAPGATDLALTYDPGGVLYYRDAAGNPARFAFTPAP